MPSITNEQMRLMYILGFVLLIACIFIRIPIAICFYQSGNSTEVVKTDTDTVSSIFVTASFLVSVIAMALTYNSLKITQKTLKLTEIEQQKRDIEQRLDLFYYPMSKYFKIGKGNETKKGVPLQKILKLKQNFSFTSKNIKK